MIYDLAPLRNHVVVLYELETWLLENGVSTLGCFVTTDTEVRFAEFFGFKRTDIYNDHDQLVMFKDLTHV